MRNFPHVGFTNSKLLGWYRFYSFFIDKETDGQHGQLLDLNRNYSQPDFALTHITKTPGKRFCFKLVGNNETVLSKTLLYLNKQAPEWFPFDNRGLKLNSPFNPKSKIQKQISDDMYVRRYSDFYGRSLYFKVYRQFFKLIRS